MKKLAKAVKAYKQGFITDEMIGRLLDSNDPSDVAFAKQLVETLAKLKIKQS